MFLFTTALVPHLPKTLASLTRNEYILGSKKLDVPLIIDVYDHFHNILEEKLDVPLIIDVYDHFHNILDEKLDVSLIIDVYDHFHNILRLFDALPNFLFSSSDAMRDY